MLQPLAMAISWSSAVGRNNDESSSGWMDEALLGVERGYLSAEDRDHLERGERRPVRLLGSFEAATNLGEDVDHRGAGCLHPVLCWPEADMRST